MSRIVSESYDKARQLLLDHIDVLNKIASQLLEKEVLNTAELDEIIGIRSGASSDQGEASPFPPQ